MKILYLINTKEYKYHGELVKEFLSVTDGEVYDLGDEDAGQTEYSQIESAKANAIITFDGTGLDLRTVMDTLSFNNLYARMAHILFHKPSYYGQILNYRQNLSMFTYIPCTEDISACRAKYTELPNIRHFKECYYKPDNERERMVNRESIRSWWEEFKGEAMI